jgi:glycosyltransferase involved in cell wall biosynthesis
LSLRVSVICPAWQAAATLAETVASVRAQIVPPSELIVVDDGSTDDTAKVGEAAGAVVIGRPHCGVAAALNAGIAASRGELLAFIDADDLWPADKLAAQTERLAADPAAAGVLGLMRWFLAPELEHDAKSRTRLPDDPQPAWLTGALLVRREAFAAVGPFDEAMHAGHAIDWFDRARRIGLVFAMPKQVVLLRRVRPGSLSSRSARRDAGYALMAWRAVQRRRASGKAE